MAENSKIEWTTHTFNPWRGCSKVHTGCANCYAESQAKRNPNTLGIWGANGSRVVASEAMWKEPLKWNKAAEKAGERHRVFCASMADVFEDWRGSMHFSDGKRVGVAYTEQQRPEDGGLAIISGAAQMVDIRRKLFELIDATPNLDWLLLTKRPENVRRMWPSSQSVDGKCPSCGESEGAHGGCGCGLLSALWGDKQTRRNNVWLGTSISDQATADKAIPELLKCRDLSPVLFLSVEPLVGPIEFSDVSRRADAVKMLGKRALSGIDWVIVGGESGNAARPCDITWIRSIVEQCKAADVSCFVKQLGAKPVNYRGEQLRFEDKKGGDWDVWPEDLRVREFPVAAVTP